MTAKKIGKRKLKKKVIGEFALYAESVKRLGELEKELNSLDTSKFQKEERAIRKKLKDVSRISEIEMDIRQLRLKIYGIDTKYLQSKIDESQNRRIGALKKEQKILGKKVRSAKELTRSDVWEVKKLPEFERFKSKTDESQNRRIRALKKEQKILGKKVRSAKELTRSDVWEVKKLPEFEERLLGLEKKELPKIKRRTGFLSRLFGRETGQIENLNKKVDKTRLEFNDNLLRDMAESRKMIEEEKFALRKQIYGLFSDYLKSVRKEKESSKQVILEQIKKMEEKIEAKINVENDAVKKGFTEKILQLRKLIESEKQEIAKLQESFEAEKSKINMMLSQDKLQLSEALNTKIAKLKRSIDQKSADLMEIDARLEKETKEPEKNVIYEERKTEELKREAMPAKKEAPVDGFAPKELLSSINVARKPLFENEFSLPFKWAGKTEGEEEPEALEEREEAEKEEPKTNKPPRVQKKIPQKTFFDHYQMQDAVRNLGEIKRAALLCKKEADEALAEKKFVLGELAKCSENMNKIISGIRQANSSFPPSKYKLSDEF